MSNNVEARAGIFRGTLGNEQLKVVLGASVGTVFEFYDFVLFGSLSPIIAAKFFVSLSPAVAIIFALFAFSVAYVVRPLGAIVFGHIGDTVGRKYTFLITVSSMGVATVLIGLIPGYHAIGIAAPILLMALRVIQGIAIGGEFGGAASYVAEHAPAGKLGSYTAAVQICASAGVVLSLLVVVGTRVSVGDAAFSAWGWRLPFIFSLLLLIASLWIRAHLSESPVYQRMKESGKGTRTPLKDLYGSWAGVRRQLAVLLGPLAAVNTLGVFALVYLMVFLQQTLHVAPQTVNLITSTAILAALPVFPLMGRVSDKVGRKPVIIGACLVAAITIFPGMRALTHFANPGFEHALEASPVVLNADPAECSFSLNPGSAERPVTSCDALRGALSHAGVDFHRSELLGGTLASASIGTTTIQGFDGTGLTPSELKHRMGELQAEVRRAVQVAGYPQQADMSRFNPAMVWLIIFYFTVLFATAQSAVAAVLVELFPASIRYTAISIPYHVSSVIAGFLLPVGFALSTVSGSIYAGLWYVVGLASVGGFVYLVALPETKNQVIADWY